MGLLIGLTVIFGLYIIFLVVLKCEEDKKNKKNKQ